MKAIAKEQQGLRTCSGRLYTKTQPWNDDMTYRVLHELRPHGKDSRFVHMPSKNQCILPRNYMYLRIEIPSILRYIPP